MDPQAAQDLLLRLMREGVITYHDYLSVFVTASTVTPR